MTSEQNYHRAFGVYGLCIENEKLLVIHKSGGPYINRFDLPGGSLEEGESLTDALRREVHEETGLQVEIDENIGVVDFKLPWLWKGHTDVHHIAVFYTVRQVAGALIEQNQFEGQDSLGALWVSEEEVSLDNASPLVLKAFDWMKTKKLTIEAECFDEWKVLN
ncbi:NUDIX hydrolase [Alkalibacillus silvisoli]|uniref:NUDIX hydrolase n=1 Tax=Alkalibacillus silvisoli TaxID=392823 RepID=A0ABP3JNU2_9BACI